MTKPIIIDGVDVSRCNRYYETKTVENPYGEVEQKKDVCFSPKIEIIQNCKSTPCMYKYMKQLEAENKKFEAANIKLVNIINERKDLEIKYKQALEEVREITKLIKDDEDKPACVYDEGCPLNGGAGFDNHCNMTCPYVLAKIIDDKINEVLKDE